MATIKDLQQLDIKKIETDALAAEITKLLREYKEVGDKEFFIETNQKFIDKFFSMTKKNYPDAISAKKAPSKAPPKKQPAKIPDDDLRDLAKKMLDKLTDLGIDLDGQDQDLIAAIRLETEEALKETALKPKIKSIVQDYKRIEPQISDAKAKKLINETIRELAKAVGVQMPRSKPDSTKADAATSKKIMEQLKKLEPELAKCRTTIREYNKKKREAEGPKPRKNRYTRLKERLLSLVSLIPDKLQDDPQVYAKTEKILLKTHRELVEVWQMSKVKAKHGAEAIKDTFDAMEEKTQKKKAQTDKKKAPKAVKNAGSLKVEIEYRDGANYKTHFTHEIDLGAFPKAKALKKGDQITMGQYGTPKQEDFFGSELHSYDYNDQDDHNLLEIIAVTKK